MVDQLVNPYHTYNAVMGCLVERSARNWGVRKGEFECIYVTIYRKTRHNAACVNIEKRSIDFLKMYCFKPTEGNG